MRYKVPMADFKPRGWYSRGYLPHFDGGDISQAVTFRLADSLPAERIWAWREELKSLPKDKASAEERKRIERWLDAGHGAAYLRDPRIADLVQSALLRFDGERYRLHAWVVMPNHVHVLVTPEKGQALSRILHSWKSYTAHEALRMLKEDAFRDCSQPSKFWQRESFDRFIRNEDHFRRCVDYIHMNPVKARLCAAPEEWRWSSAGESA
ncbi:MAG: transposase [Chthonomonadaceae bacterium]|nr:MAG: transposase [Chthonomonadaceae bacterium]